VSRDRRAVSIADALDLDVTNFWSGRQGCCTCTTRIICRRGHLPWREPMDHFGRHHDQPPL